MGWNNVETYMENLELIKKNGINSLSKNYDIILLFFRKILKWLNINGLMEIMQVLTAALTNVI